LNKDMAVELRRARTVSIHSGGLEVAVKTAAPTVGEALLEAGLPLQGMDRTLPAEDEAVPADGQIQLVRVREVVALAQELLPFENSFTTTPDLELDQRQVIQPGRYGVVVNRERVRYEDGVEVARLHEEQWTAAEPQGQVVGLGTQPVIRTLDTGSGTIEYYRAVTMYATSYSPCQQGMGRCSKATASGLPLQKGVVGVTSAWYRLFAGAQVYIPGYGIGIIGDVGGGIPGKYLIDLGYSEEDYEAWHQNVTVYFLTPVPANVPAILP
jgi:3D (Asp-Asp-Asp) domain-containing protein